MRGELGADLGEAVGEDPVEPVAGLVVEGRPAGGVDEVGAGGGGSADGAHRQRGELGERALEVADVDVFVDADVVDRVAGEAGVVAALGVAEHLGRPREGVVGEQFDDEDLHHRPHEQLQLGGDVVAQAVEHAADADRFG